MNKMVKSLTIDLLLVYLLIHLNSMELTQKN